MSGSLWAGGSGEFTVPDQWEATGGSPPATSPSSSEIAYYILGGDVVFTGNANEAAEVNSPATFDLSAGGYALEAAAGDVDTGLLLGTGYSLNTPTPT